MLASVGAFLWRFLPILGVISAAKPEPGFSLNDWPRRTARFFWEVMLQAKVIAERPLPGLAHAFVFWGFCAFGLVTVDHIARGYGYPIFSHDAGFGRVYFALAAAFAALTAVSIAGLFVRRFLIRPRWLGDKLSYESGFIAALIFILMLTYLADWWLAGRAGALNWWLHTLALFAFLPLIPHTKHLHLVMSPVAVFAMRGGFSQIPPLAGDEDFGLVTGNDVTQVAALQAYSCVECGRCTEHCPASNTGKELNPKQIILGLRGYLNDFGPKSAEPLLGQYLSQKAAFQCTTCGACEYQCPVGIQHLPVIIGLRRGATNTGAWEDDYGAKLFRNLEKNGNPLGLSASERDKFVTKAALPIFDGTQDYCLWLGCMGSFDNRGRDIIEALVKVLRHLKVSFGVLKKERCSGDAARRLGNDLAFADLAEQNRKVLSAWGDKAPKLISICPHCVRTIGEDWKEFGAPPEIEHHTQFLARHANSLPQLDSSSTVYHDPCYLGRYQNIYDEPRRLLGSPKEAPRHRERSFCCGAGGGLTFLGEEEGTRVNETRARELAETGAATIATGCPFCQTMFQAALTQITLPTPAPALKDIAELLAEKLPTRDPTMLV
jgi:Fe-S oxidoreductase